MCLWCLCYCYNGNKKEPDTSSSIKRCHTGCSLDTRLLVSACVPRLMLMGVMNRIYVQSSNSALFYKDNDNTFQQLKECSVLLRGVLQFDTSRQNCSVSPRSTKNCKTCNILITDTFFTSNVTCKSYQCAIAEDLDCKSRNVIYGTECTICGLEYVGETKGQLNKRMTGHRFEINHGGNQLLYQYFNQPYHSVVPWKYVCWKTYITRPTIQIWVHL